jgi:putative DNA primase/helicase
VKAGGSVQIDRLSISVFGGLQPDRLTTLLLGGDDDGLPARFIWAWPNPLPPARPRRVASGEFIRAAFGRLWALRPGRDESGDVPILMHLTGDAADEFQDWREAHAREAGGISGLIESAWGKLPGLLLRLAMTLELGAWATGPAGTPEPAEVSRPSILRAIGLIETYLKPMSERVYGDAAVPLVERHAMTLARWIAHKRIPLINAREVKRSAGLPGLRDMPAVEAAITVLVDANWVRADSDLSGGRPRKDFLVNPKVFALLEGGRHGNG